MHLSKIDLNLFVVFDTIYAEASITRASQRLNLSQPAISHALGRMRQIFGDPLFIRHGRTMTPTPLARQIIDPIRQSLQRLELTLNKVDRFDPASASKTFTIGFPSAVLESVVLPKLLRNVFKLAPRIDISAVRAERHELESELSAGTLDTAIDMLMPLSEDIRRQRLRGEWYVVVARRNHPSVRSGLDLTTYLEQDHIQASARRRGLSMEDFELGRHNLRRRIRLRCQHYFAACQVVSETDLILTMPESYARIINPQFNNQLLPFPLKVPVFDTFLYWHVNAENDPANAWLRQQLINAAQDVSATVSSRRNIAKRQRAV